MKYLFSGLCFILYIHENLIQLNNQNMFLQSKFYPKVTFTLEEPRNCFLCVLKVEKLIFLCIF